jgi:hypothetical protein
MTARAAGHSVAWAGLMVAGLSCASLALPAPAPARLVALLAFACVGPGAAVLGHLRFADPVVSWAMVVVLSLATFAGVATAQVWAAWWHPRVAILALSIVVGLSCLSAVRGPTLALLRRKSGSEVVS